ncbi:MAG: outer membrane lipoprotein-sorting protein [Alphaproteobacteria bacterium]|nr:outer membrane lipoprotein-sorting protein [Alphaproteobacteria bacterium]
MRRSAFATIFAAVIVLPAHAIAASADALVRAAFDNWRARSSQTEVTMLVHRPDWQRSMTIKAFTRGNNDALVRFTAPAEDRGNATLKRGDDTWIFNPKLNQVIKLPPSMLAQSWMGSDFSYNDLSKSEELLTDYTHKIVAQTTSGAHTVYTIDAIPKPGAPVVWGKLEVRIRDDGVMLGETYFDQDMKVVRRMTTDKVGRIGGRPYPLTMTMHPAHHPGQWTQIKTTSGRFNISLPDYLFTLSNLQNPRE